MKRVIFIALLAGLACACTKENPLAPLPNLSAVRANLAFTCVHQDDHLPPLDPDADQLFKYARWLQKRDGAKDFDDIARYYRIAAAHGHYKANVNLQQLVSTGLADSPNARKETVDLAIQLVKQGVPGGYYDIAHYLELGYGLKQDSETALRYFRKAADLGSPEAQYYLAEKLDPIDAAPEVALQMYRCAADQGHGNAATSMAIGLKTDKSYAEGLKAFQQGVIAGNRQAAWALENGFAVTPQNRALYYLDVQNDPERSRRYKLIGKFLDDNESLNPKVPDIDQIVPLPPEKLPPWDGTFQWQKEQDAAVPPPKPAESLVEKLAREKDLDPATGLPLKPEKSAQAGHVPLGTTAYTNEVCPQEGVWCAKQPQGSGHRPDRATTTREAAAMGRHVPVAEGAGRRHAAAEACRIARRETGSREEPRFRDGLATLARQKRGGRTSSVRHACAHWREFACRIARRPFPILR